MSVRRFVLFALIATAAHAQLAPWPEGARLFSSQRGWTGADAAYAIPLAPGRPDLVSRGSAPGPHLARGEAADDRSLRSPDSPRAPGPSGRILWLFGDTLVGEVAGGRREHVVMVRNTAAIQDGPRMTFHLGSGVPGVFAPPDGHGWFWPLDGVRAGHALFVFLSQVESTGDLSAFGFGVVRHWLARVDNPDDPPPDWRVAMTALPFEGYGIACAVDGAALYVYGYRDEKRAAGLRRSAVVARSPLHALERFARWRFWDGARWSADARAAAPLFDEWPTEASVHRDGDGRWVALYSRSGMSPEILVRTADRPQGPWSAPRVVYRCPEAAQAGVFCYAAKAHPALGIVTYCTNSTDLARVIGDDRLYRPVVLRGRLR